jgi:hypothetical protein
MAVSAQHLPAIGKSPVAMLGTGFMLTWVIRPRQQLLALFLMTCGCITFGLWAHVPVLLVEAWRVPTWQFVLLWIGDAAGLVMFLYAIVQSDDQWSPDPEAENPEYQRKLLWFYAICFLLPWLIDLAASLALRSAEQASFRSAATTVGEVQKLAIWDAERGVYRHRYHLHCIFRDAAGAQHETIQILYADQQGILGGNLPAAVKEALGRGQTPFAIRIAYRPEAPEQAWLADVGPGYGWNLHRFSLELLAGQCFFMLVLIIGPLLTVADRGSAVDWRKTVADIPMYVRAAVPMIIEAVWLACMGYFELTLFHRVA